MSVSVELVEGEKDWANVAQRSAFGLDGLPTLRKLLAESAVVYVGKYEGEIACVYGLVPPTLLSESVYLWLLTTELVAQHPFLFVRHSQRVVEQILKKHPMIIGTTSHSNKSAISWLKWLGAEYSEGRNGMLNFVIRRKG